MRHLHLFPNEKFTNPYINFVNNNFDSKDHLFLIIGKGINTKITPEENVKKISKNSMDLLLILKEMYRCNKIFLHGLFFKQIVLIYFLNPWLLKKSNWIIWGGDLYWYRYRKESFKSNLYERVRRFVIKNMGGLITHIKGDYELAKLWYGAKGKYYYSFMYPSNLFKKYDISKVKKAKEKICILVGNSADPTNNHLEVFNKLEKYKSEAIQIICPLSYGSVEYSERVIEEGNRIFGDKFYPLLEFIPFEEYLKLLAKIDIAIFNHERQQAMGNIITLLGLGKKVYARKETTSMQFFNDIGIQMFNSSDIDSCKGLLRDINKLNLNNIDIVKNLFSEEELKKQLYDIFNKGP